MKCLETFTIYENPAPLLVSRQAIFPGIVQLADGELVALFTIGEAFDAADARAYLSRSSDEGKTWSAPARLSQREQAPEESESFKPLLLRDGSLVATGYVFVRPTPLTPVVDPETFELLRLRNKVSFSSDGGRSWSEPDYLDIEGQPLELSGPCIELSSGRLLGATAPFHLKKDGHSGWIIASDDKGKSWFKLSEFYKSPTGSVASWECRLCEMSPGRVAVIMWAYDNATSANLDNKLAVSDDGGVTFRTIETGVHGQASNLLPLGGDKLLTIHAHREAPVGLIVRRVDIGGDRFTIEEELDLLGNGGMASDSADIRKQFASLKFGQPSLLKLAGGDILAACWSFENNQYVIKGYRLAL
jgi:sialidase-1